MKLRSLRIPRAAVLPARTWKNCPIGSVVRLILAFILMFGAAPASVAVRILLGVGDRAETNWDGGVTVRGARISAVEPWRFDRDDAMLPGNRWKINRHVTRRFGTAANPAVRTFSANSVVVMNRGEDGRNGA